MPKRHSRVQKRKLKGGDGLFSSIGNLFGSKKNDNVNKSSSDSYFGLGNLFSSKNTTTPSTTTYTPTPTPTYTPTPTPSYTPTPTYTPTTTTYTPTTTTPTTTTTSSTSMNNPSSDYVSTATPFPYGGKNKKLKKGMKGGYKYYTPNTGLAANAASFSGPTAEPHTYVGGKTRRRRRRGTKSRKQKKY